MMYHKHCVNILYIAWIYNRVENEKMSRKERMKFFYLRLCFGENQV